MKSGQNNPIPHQDLLGLSQGSKQASSIQMITDRVSQAFCHRFVILQNLLTSCDKRIKEAQHFVTLMTYQKQKSCLESQQQTMKEQFSTPENSFEFRLENILRIKNPFSRLIFSREPPKFVIKNKKFNLEIQIQRLNGDPLLINQILLLDIIIFTSVAPITRIQANITGKPILKKATNFVLHDGKCLIEGISISEVSSHFPGGTVQLAVVAKSKKQNSNLFQKVRPAIIQKLQVKSKMLKN